MTPPERMTADAVMKAAVALYAEKGGLLGGMLVGECLRSAITEALKAAEAQGRREAKEECKEHVKEAYRHCLENHKIALAPQGDPGQKETKS